MGKKVVCYYCKVHLSTVAYKHKEYCPIYTAYLEGWKRGLAVGETGSLVY